MSSRELHAIEGGAEEKPIQRFSNDGELADFDELDELIEASSLGSPAAKLIRSITSDEEIERFGRRLRSTTSQADSPPAEENPDIEDTSTELDVDDAILALVRMVRVLGDGPDRRRPDVHSTDALDIGSEDFRMGLRTSSQLGDFVSCMAGLTLSTSNVPVMYGNGMHTVMLLAAQPGGPAKLLRYLLDHQALIQVRDDVAWSIIWITFSDFDNAPLAVRHACAEVLAGTSLAEGLVDEFTRAALAPPPVSAPDPSFFPPRIAGNESGKEQNHRRLEPSSRRDTVRIVFPSRRLDRSYRDRSSPCPAARDPLTVCATAFHPLALLAGLSTWGCPEPGSRQQRVGSLSTAGEAGNSSRIVAGVVFRGFFLVVMIALAAVVSVSFK